MSLTVEHAAAIKAEQAPTMTPTQIATNTEPSTKSRIESLKRDQDDLQRSSDTWNAVYIVALCLTVVVAAIAGFSQWKTISLSRRLVLIDSKIESEKDRISAEDSKNKDIKIGESKERAASAEEAAGKANERAAGFEKQAAALTADAERSRAAIALANQRTEELRKENFQLSLSLQSSQRELAQLTQSVSERAVNPFALRDAMNPFAGTKAIVEYTKDLPELKRLAIMIADGLSDARWEPAATRLPKLPSGNIPREMIEPTLATSSPEMPDGRILEVFEEGVWVWDSVIGGHQDTPAAMLVQELNRQSIEARYMSGFPDTEGVVTVLVGLHRPPSAPVLMIAPAHPKKD